MMLKAWPTGRLSPKDVAQLDLHPHEDGTIRIGPYVYWWDMAAESWIRVVHISEVPKRGER